MSSHKESIKEYIELLDEDTQAKVAVAIEDLRKGRKKKDWHWIDVALHKKSPEMWRRYGCGLLFNDNFNASVYEQIEREKRFATADVSALFRELDSTDEAMDDQIESEANMTTDAAQSISKTAADIIRSRSMEPQQNCYFDDNGDFKF